NSSCIKVTRRAHVAASGTAGNVPMAISKARWKAVTISCSSLILCTLSPYYLLILTAHNFHAALSQKAWGDTRTGAMRPVMTIILHIGYTEASLYRELSLPGGSEVSISSPGRWWSHSWPMLCWGTVVSRVMLMYVDKGQAGRCARL